MNEFNEISPLLQASSIYLNSKNIKRQQKNLTEQAKSALYLEELRQEHQIKMSYLTQEFQKNNRWEEADRRAIDQRQHQENEYLLRAHQQRLERMKVPYYAPTKWVQSRLPNAPAPFVIMSLNPFQEHNPFKNEAVRIAPFSRIAKELRERNAEYENHLFSIITTQEVFASDEEVREFYHRELNCPCLVIYGEFTGSSFAVNALYAGLEYNQIKFSGNRPKDLGPKVVRVWEVSYKTIESLKQNYAQKGDKYGWLEALETYTETHVGLFVQLMLDNLFSYSPRQMYEVKTPLFLQFKEEELTRLGIWEALKTTLLERYEVLKERQIEAKQLTKLSISKIVDGQFFSFDSNSLVLFDDGFWGFSDDNGKFYKPLFIEGDSSFSSNAIKIRNENNKIGFMTNYGSISIPFEYEDADVMKENFVAVKKNGKWGLLSFDGEIAIPFIYKYLRSPVEGKVIFSLDNDHVGLMNIDGQLCVEGKFSAITDLVDGLFFGHSINNEDKMGIYSVDGEELMPQLYYPLRSRNLGNGIFVLSTGL